MNNIKPSVVKHDKLEDVLSEKLGRDYWYRFVIPTMNIFGATTGAIEQRIKKEVKMHGRSRSRRQVPKQ